MKKAMYWHKEENAIRCELCPNNCLITEGKKGICNVRTNINNCLYSENYGIISAINLDPIEKKPLYHFFPGEKILSVGSIGCNFKCSFCQNWEISQTSINNSHKIKSFSIDEITQAALEFPENIGVAFTYNEPTIWYEFMLDLAKKNKTFNLKNVLVSNGYIQEKPLLDLIPYIDAFSIDLKAFNEKFYHDISKGRLNPVLNSLKIIKNSKKHLEIDFLLIPQLNDNFELFKSMLIWIQENLGKDTILHINKYYPAYQLDLSATSDDTLLAFFKEAKKILNYVYLGNTSLNEGQNTYCSTCQKKVIERHGYSIYTDELDSDGCCKFCKNKIINHI